MHPLLKIAVAAASLLLAAAMPARCAEVTVDDAARFLAGLTTPQAAEEEGGHVEDIVVTARYRSENLQRTPLAITAVSATKLEERGATNILGVASAAPNVVLNQLGAGFGPTLSASIRAAFAFILSGTAVFLGVLFLLSAAAAVRIFAHERTAWLDGILLPAVATLALLGVLGVSVVLDDRPTQLFLLVMGLAGVPFAWWRGVGRSSVPRL